MCYISVHSFLNDGERLEKVRELLKLIDEKAEAESSSDLIGLQKFYRYKEIHKVRIWRQLFSEFNLLVIK